MSSEPEPLAGTLEARGLQMPLADGELLAEALLLAKVVLPDGTVVVRWASTEGADWTSRRALLEIARDRERFAPGRE